MTEQESFIKKLSILLEEKNITQRELAEKINVTEVTISRYLSGERSPRIEIVSKIAVSLAFIPKFNYLCKGSA